MKMKTGNFGRLRICDVAISNTLPCLLLIAPIFFSGCELATARANNVLNSQTDIAPEIVNIDFYGYAIQSATVIGKTIPNSEIDAGGIITKADEEGNFVFGFDRDAPSTVTISVTTPKGHSASRIFKLEKREYKVATIHGLPPATVNPPPEAMARIQADSALKQKSFDSKEASVKGYLETFRWPLDEVIITSSWGAQRSLNGNLQRPHYGVDLGAPKGAPIYAPASGKVILAQTGMHFEGGMVGIDHGQGLITNYLHMSKILVKPDQIVKAGDKIGEVGAEGRATGPHLCWRMRWRGRQLDPTKMVKPLPQLPVNVEALALK